MFLEEGKIGKNDWLSMKKEAACAQIPACEIDERVVERTDFLERLNDVVVVVADFWKGQMMPIIRLRFVFKDDLKRRQVVDFQ